ncbi:MAG: right-handed parallel beta-helix repeat-containing protein [Candidatus Hydrogenedentes bacterium]|nr:right-handed parallel beta-helix repeat-containing protein [Candidatus Hydrogenedentota bacterium]
MKNLGICLLVVSWCFSVLPSGADVPVIPGAQGFGITTPAGRGGVVVHVTNLYPTGEGSLAAAFQVRGPRVIVFDVGGVIELTENLVLDEPFVTMAGQTAPSPGITLVGAGLVVRAHDALIQHLRIRVGDRKEGPRPDSRDGVAILGRDDGEGAYNVVLDHCSVSWAIDEGISTWYMGVHDVTIRACISAENLSKSLHPKGEHSKGILIGDHSKRVAVLNNLFAHNTQRHPLIKGDVEAVVANNLIYNPGTQGIHFSDPEGSGPCKADVVGNVFVPGKSTWQTLGLFSLIRAFSDTKPGSQLFIGENGIAKSVDAAVTVYESVKVPVSLRVPVPAVMPGTWRLLLADEVIAWVTQHAGARPTDRDEGRIIDSPEEVGGFPKPAPAYKKAVPPENPNGDEDGDGYTNVEEWLHAQAAAVK